MGREGIALRCGIDPGPARILILSDSNLPQQIAGGFSQGCDRALHNAVRARVWARRDVNRMHSFILEQLADAEDVIGVADRDATVQAVGAHDDGDAFGGLGCIAALRFGNEAALWDAVMHEVIAADPTFTKRRVEGGSAGGDDYGRQSAMEDIKRVVKASSQDGRRIGPSIPPRRRPQSRRLDEAPPETKPRQPAPRSQSETKEVRPPGKSTDQATIAYGEAGWQAGRSSLGEELRDLVGRNCAFADDAPACSLIAEVNDCGRDLAREKCRHRR